MKITCDSCGAKYTIADDKVSGRKVKIRCKGCGTPIVVDGAAKTAAGGTTDAGPLRNDSSIPAEPALSSMPPAASSAEWSVNLSETDQRTMTTDELVQGWKNGSVTTDAFVWKEGMADWVPILECAELTASLNAPEASAAAAPAQAAAARPASARPAAAAARSGAGRVQVGTDLFAGAAASGSETEDVNTSAPVLPQGARGDDGKPTGQRNENSVLFSLDALKAGFAAPAAKPAEAPKRGAPGRGGAASDDPFGLGGAAVAAAPMFSMADNAALLTAPAPPEPPKPVVSFAADPSAPPQAQGSKKGLMIGVVAVLLVGGAGAAFALSAKKDKDEALAQAAAAAASAEKAREEERKARAAEEKAREEQKEEAAKATAAAIAAAEAGNKAAEEKSGEAKKDAAATGAGAKPGAATTAAKKDEKKDTAATPPPAAGGDQPFNKGAAVSALSAAAGGAASCKKLGGPTGSGKVQVTFAPSGRVTTANVSGAPFGGTSVGGCVASIFRKAKVPPFSGSPITVSKSFTIN